jgi:AraC-like DNA-binding protein
MGTNGAERKMGMYEENAEITEAVEAVYSIASSLNRGSILTHEQIRSVLGIKPHEGIWDYVLHKVRRRLERERGIATWASYTVGYRLLSHAEQLEALTWRVRKGLRQVRKGRGHVEALPDRGLTLHQRRLRSILVDQAREAETTLRRELRDQRRTIRPIETQPRRPLPTS